jgi:hypothetical protein
MGMDRYSTAVILLCACATARPFPLDSMYARGDSCLSIVWTPDSANTNSDWYAKNGSLCTGADTMYRHCDFTAGTTYRSIAYSYGGEDPYFQFRDKLGRGLLAGSHLCHYQTVGDPSPYVAGTDCSGFVCYLWNAPRVSTGGLVADPQYQKISKSVLEPGDILVKAGSHAVFVVEKDDSAVFLIWESTSAVNGCRERIINVNDAAWDPYVALRNPGIMRAADFGHVSNIRPGGMIRITASREGSRLDLRFVSPISGEITLFAAAGKCIGRKSVAPGSARIAWTLPAPLPAGTYIAAVQTVQNGFLSARCTVVK